MSWSATPCACASEIRPPCAPVRPGRYEALLPGSPVAPSHTSATTYLAGSVEQIKKSGHAALTVHPAGLAVHQPPSRA